MKRGKNTRVGAKTGDLTPVAGGALELPKDTEPWTMDESLKKARVVKISSQVAARSRYLGWMCTVDYGKGFAVGAVFQDAVTAKRFVQYVP